MVSVRSFRHLALFMSCYLSGCAVDTGLEDGTWQATGKVAEASLVVMPDGTGRLDFVFDYLLGLVDDDGIGEVTWSYSLTDRTRRAYGSVTEPMRQLKPDEASPYLWKDENTESRTGAGGASTKPNLCSLIKIFYKETTLYELLIPVGEGTPYFNPQPLDDIREFSIGR